jgi:hypothetical protein
MKGGFEGRFAPALFGAAVWVISSTEMISAISGRQVVSASRRQPAPAAKQLTLKSRALSFNETASHPRFCRSLTDEPSLIQRIALRRRRLVSIEHDRLLRSDHALQAPVWKRPAVPSIADGRFASGSRPFIQSTQSANGEHRHHGGAGAFCPFSDFAVSTALASWLSAQLAHHLPLKEARLQG